MIRQNPVDLFRHGFVEAAQAGFDMYYRNMQFTGSQRSGQCRIGVSIYDYIIRPVFRQDLFDFDKHLSGHCSMRGMSAMQLPGRTCHIHFGEENTAHVLVVMLPGMDQLFPDCFLSCLIMQLDGPAQHGRFNELRACTYNCNYLFHWIKTFNRRTYNVL